VLVVLVVVIGLVASIDPDVSSPASAVPDSQKAPSVRDAVLAGMNDALDTIDGAGAADIAPALAQLRTRLQPALTGPPATTTQTLPAKVPGVAQEEPADQTTQTTNPRTNGRRKATHATE
jgi:hypothetical protein